ncbi:MAG TPA: hypothetical protein DDW49_09230 [Deltaproteobacteria bacterium]|nr:MAG: hypothetical protein A2048_08690 [Deltaproteobacteria bacterium GWA2_45_12]HBF13543.1 hypothetical protein [Deltaproteobacteria bacterium]
MIKKQLPKPKVLSTYKPIAAILGVSVRTIIRNWKSIPCITKRGNRIWVVEEDLLNWFRENPNLWRKKNEFYGVNMLSLFLCWHSLSGEKSFVMGHPHFNFEIKYY